jgi:hypothetical protein
VRGGGGGGRGRAGGGAAPPPPPPPPPAARSSGPYLTREQAVCIATDGGRIGATATEAWFTTYGAWERPLGSRRVGVDVDREVWIVWMYAPGRGPVPPCRPGTPNELCLRGVPGGDKDSFHDVVDATTGFVYANGYARPDWLGCPSWASPGRPSLEARVPYPGFVRATPTATPAGPGPHPAGVPDLSGLEPTPVRTVDLAPQLAERDKATLIVRHADCTNEAILVAPGQAEGVVSGLPAGDRLVASVPPAALMGQRAPPPVPARTPPAGTPSVVPVRRP